MGNPTIDILMITYNRPHYTRLSLQQLLDTCDETMRVWIWQNGNDSATLEVARSFLTHPKYGDVFNSVQAQSLQGATKEIYSMRLLRSLCSLAMTYIKYVTVFMTPCTNTERDSIGKHKIYCFVSIMDTVNVRNGL